MLEISKDAAHPGRSKGSARAGGARVHLSGANCLAGGALEQLLLV